MERPAELRQRTGEELATLRRSLLDDVLKFRIQKTTNQIENTMQIRRTRRQLARVETILAARGQGLEVAPAESSLRAQAESGEE